MRLTLGFALAAALGGFSACAAPTCGNGYDISPAARLPLTGRSEL